MQQPPSPRSIPMQPLGRKRSSSIKRINRNNSQSNTSSSPPSPKSSSSPRSVSFNTLNLNATTMNDLYGTNSNSNSNDNNNNNQPPPSSPRLFIAPPQQQQQPVQPHPSNHLSNTPPKGFRDKFLFYRAELFIFLDYPSSSKWVCIFVVLCCVVVYSFIVLLHFHL